MVLLFMNQSQSNILPKLSLKLLKAEQEQNDVFCGVRLIHSEVLSPFRLNLNMSLCFKMLSFILAEVEALNQSKICLRGDLQPALKWVAT